MPFEVFCLTTIYDSSNFTDFHASLATKYLPVTQIFIFDILVQEFLVVITQLNHYSTELIILIVIFGANDTEAQQTRAFLIVIVAWSRLRL